VTLTFELEVDGIKLDQHAMYLGQRSFTSKITVEMHGHT